MSIIILLERNRHDLGVTEAVYIYVVVTDAKREVDPEPYP